MKPYKVWCGKTPKQIADAREKAIVKSRSEKMNHKIVGTIGRIAKSDTIRAKMMLNSARCNILFHEGNINCEEWQALQHENDMLAKKLQELKTKEYRAAGVRQNFSGIKMEE